MPLHRDINQLYHRTVVEKPYKQYPQKHVYQKKKKKSQKQRFHLFTVFM